MNTESPFPDHVVKTIRAQFPVLQKTFGDKTLCYLDNTATTQKPLQVIDAMDHFYRDHYSSVKRGVYQLSELTNVKYENTRKKVQHFINAKQPEEVIFTRGTTESLNLVAQSWGRANLQPGDEVIISALEHHANIVPWQMICNEKQAVLKVIPCNDKAELILEEYKKLLGPKTKLVSVNHISNATGTINPIQTIINLAKEYNAITCIDAAQSIAHMPIDVQELDCDFLAFSGHKMYGPTGIGVLYGKYHLLANMPPYQTGGEMIEQVTFAKTTFAAPPSRFEAGTPAIAEVIGLGEAISFIQDTGLATIGQIEHELLQIAEQKLAAIPGLVVIGQAEQKASLISFVLHTDAQKNTLIHPHDAAMIFDEEAIAVRTGHHCAQPVMDRFKVPATIRASFAVYNTPQEIDALVDCIHRVIKIFKWSS
jgi:cysteine desulfurase / selenocysteine lyase